MGKASFKEIIFGIFSGLAVFWLGIYSLGALSANLPLLAVLAMAISLCILAGGLAGWFSRNWGWLFGGLVATPFSLLCIAFGLLLYTPFWVFTPLAILGMSYSFSPSQVGIGLIILGTIVLIFAIFGGFLGEKLYWQFHK